MDIISYRNVDYDKILMCVEWRKKYRRNIYTLANIIALDTETSKYSDDILYITDWSLTIEKYGCIYGNNIQDLISLLENLITQLECNSNRKMMVFVHNFPYDYMFLRNHLFEKFGMPGFCLASKPHKYIAMSFENGLEFRDSYILTGRSLEKFAKDMNTEVKKQVGTWDYNKFRTPKSGRTEKEIFYVCADTISLCMALREFFKQHKCNTATVQYTNTGFVRDAALKASRTDKKWRYIFRESRLDVDLYGLIDLAFHGGYTHANRFCIGKIYNDVVSYDFTSSYPARMIYNKFPMGAWGVLHDISIHDIIDMSDDYAFIGHAIFTGLEIKGGFPMPPIARAKCLLLKGGIVDNGRVVNADIAIVPFSDPDLKLYTKYYNYSAVKVKNVRFCRKKYLPDWFCDLIMEFFRGKTTLKGVDDVLYMLSKGMLNSLYGMSVQKIIRPDNVENFDDGEWLYQKPDEEKSSEILDKFYKNSKKCLPYQWGVYVTAYAQEELFKLGECCKLWLYSDTDSVKGIGWDIEKLQRYNYDIIQQSKSRGYGSIEYNGKRYTLGIADHDGDYEEFVTLGSKRYCVREDGKLHITVAGVPKIGVGELEDDISKFRKDMVFKNTQKMASTYIVKNGIQTVKIGSEIIEYGSAVRLDPVEYTLDQTQLFDPITGKPYEEVQY